MTHHFDPTSLREYDIRGIIGKTLGEGDAYAVGRSFGSRVARAGGRQVAVGYDGRTSSPGLSSEPLAASRRSSEIIVTSASQRSGQSARRLPYRPAKPS